MKHEMRVVGGMAVCLPHGAFIKPEKPEQPKRIVVGETVALLTEDAPEEGIPCRVIGHVGDNVWELEQGDTRLHAPGHRIRVMPRFRDLLNPE